MLGPDQFAVGLDVPPHEAGVAIHHVVPGWTWQTMHWLVGIDGGEAVLDRVARLVSRDGRVGAEAGAAVAELRVRTRGDSPAVVGVDDVAGRAAARSVVAGLVVGAKEVGRRVEAAGSWSGRRRPGRCGSSCRARGPRRPVLGRPGSSKMSGMPTSRGMPPASLEDTEHIARLTDLVARQGVEVGQDALGHGSRPPSAVAPSGAGAGRRSSRKPRRSEPISRGRTRCCTEPPPRACSRGPSCSCGSARPPRRGSSSCRSSCAPRGNRPG